MPHIVLLDTGILLRLTRMDKNQFDALVLGPCRQLATDVL
ncbi:hypothetical protein SAMN04487951_11013 [Vreelandella arcis]|uniref:Uncharacterized protein n=1 Tax=Vreelandella arcis TaxID=416873 RepID=A0A1H0FH67_9GAMM|nr:hypothetical protein SAMN04487951_11013 [Halomonas arcis]